MADAQPTPRKDFKRLKRAGNKLVEAAGRKAEAFALILRHAIASGEAGEVVRNYLRFEAQQRALTLRIAKAISPAAQTTEQFCLPGIVDERAPAPTARAYRSHTDRLAHELSAAAIAGSEMFESILRVAVGGSEAAAEAMREYLKLELKHRGIIKNMLQSLSPRSRVEGSYYTQILDMIDDKPEKVWARSQILTRLAESNNQKPEAIQNNVDDALHRLVREAMVVRIGQGLYRAVREE